VQGSYIDVHDNENVYLSVDKADVTVNGRVQSPKADAGEKEVIEGPSVNQQQPPKSHETTLTERRQEILDQLLALVDKGDWMHDGIADGVKKMVLTVLGQGKTPLTGKEAEMSAALWHLLENQRGDRVKIVWQNIVGYLDDKKLFPIKGSPALNRDFFGNDDGYTNIDKGRPSRNNLSNGFRDVLPLLDAYVPKGHRGV